MKCSILLASSSLLIAALAACSPGANSAPVDSSSHAAVVAAKPTSTILSRRSVSPLIGVYEQGLPKSYSLVSDFTAATGQRPRLVLYYSGWYEKFWTGFAQTAYKNSAIPFVQLQSGNTSVAAISSGRYDRYLKSYAKAVRAYGHPVFLSFDHEMNGTWYSWGAGHISPAVFISAWRHLVRVFRSEGATNVTWLWTVNSVNAARSSLHQWWPGGAWVNAVGIDGYYYYKSDTFASVFGTTVTEVRKFTNDPILISETAVGPVAGPSKIAGLFAGIRTDHLLGLVWFDKAQHDPPFHQDWRLENNPAILAAFRTAVG